MILWIDAQLSPALASWLESNFDISALALRDVGLRDATDREVFLAARARGATIMTKDSDFVHLLEQLGPPPQLIWITIGNTSNAKLKEKLTSQLPDGITRLLHGETLIKIS